MIQIVTFFLLTYESTSIKFVKLSESTYKKHFESQYKRLDIIGMMTDAYNNNGPTML